MNTVIIDDEPHARSVLRTILNQYCPELNITGEASDVSSAVELILSSEPELVLLDVQLGEKTCFDLLSQLEEKNFNIIFVTAHDHYAIPAIRLAAIDYLLKPVQPEELMKAVARCMELRKTKSGPERMNTFVQNHSTPQKRIMLPGPGGFEVISIGQIMYCIANGNYTEFYLTEGKKITVAKTLGEYESILEPAGLIRIHLSHIVNVSFVKSYSGGRGGTIVMTDGRELQLSQRRKQEFIQKLGLY